MKRDDVKTLVEMKVGSHLYGTATETSDLDIKGIYKPSAEQILLQRVAHVISFSPKKAAGQRNDNDDVDCDFYSPAKFLLLLADCHPIPLEMVFAPESAYFGDPDPLWAKIRDFGIGLTNRKANVFVTCSKAHIKRSVNRCARDRAAVAVFNAVSDAIAVHGGSARLSIIEDQLIELAEGHESMLAMGQTASTNKNNGDKYVDVLNKKVLLSFPLDQALSVVRLVSDTAAKYNNDAGVDWKTLSHAVRFALEALEFMETGRITLPLPQAGHLLAIKMGKVPYEEVESELNGLLEQLERLKVKVSKDEELKTSRLIDEFVMQLHRDVILGRFD